jgi:hypothetical protein
MAKYAAAAFDDLNRDGSSIAQAKVSATMTPTPWLISSRARVSVRAIDRSRFAKPSN